MTCELCDGTGFVQTADLVIVNKAGDERRYTQVEPCRCRKPSKRTSDARYDDTHLFGDRT